MTSPNNTNDQNEADESMKETGPLPLEYKYFKHIYDLIEFGIPKIIETEDVFYDWFLKELQIYEAKNPIKLYRGHSDASWLMVSTLYREAEYYGSDFNTLEKAHHEYVKTLLGDLRNMSSNEQILAYSQHYGMKSSFLDVTFNPLVALYFATEKNEVKNNDSELKYYFSIIELTDSTSFGNWEKSSNICARALKDGCSDNAMIEEIVNESRNNSVVQELKGIEKPVWIGETEGRTITNPRMRAQEGAFLYQCKHADVPFEAVVKWMKQTMPIFEHIQMRHVLISRKLFLLVREILAKYEINSHTLLLDEMPT